MAKLSELATRITLFKNNQQAQYLDLSNLELDALPDWVFDESFLSRVIELDLSGNNFLYLSIFQLNRLTNLEKLKLKNNPLDLPEKVIESENFHLIIETLAARQTDVSENKSQINQLLGHENDAAEVKAHIFVRMLTAIYNLLLKIPLISKASSPEVAALEVKINRMPLSQKSKIWESIYGPFPRPINEQHLSSYAALRSILKELSLTTIVILNCLISFILWIVIGYFFNQILFLTLSDWWVTKFYRLWLFFTTIWVVIGFGPVAFISLKDGAWNLWKPYYGFEQRETYGTSKWLMPRMLHYTYGWLYSYQPLEEIDKSLKSLIIKYFLWISVKWQIGKVPTSPVENGMFPIAPFGYKTWFCLPVPEISRHALIFGLPGSGKSASFAMSYVRTAGELGSAVMMDIKGELFRHSSHRFRSVYRFDFEESSYSDRFLLGRMCRNDLEFAQTLAQSIVGFRPGDKASGGNDSFFQAAGMNLLAATLLHLAEININFTPGDIFQFIADHPIDAKNANGFIKTLAASPNSYTRKIIGGMPTMADVTFAGVVSNMTTALQTFENPHVMKVLSPPTPEEAKNGCRIFDPIYLRKQSTGLFIVVPEGKADQIANVTGSVINVIGNALRRAATVEEMDTFLLSHAARMLPSEYINQSLENYTAAKFNQFKKENYFQVQQILYKKFSAMRGFADNYIVSDDKIEASLKLKFNEVVQKPSFFNEFAEQIKTKYIADNQLESIYKNISTVFFIIDEAGNVKLSQLRQDTGVGRGRRMSYILFYHNIAQIYVQFGKDYAETLLGTVALRIFLPGLEGETAKYASFICRRTTTLQKSGTDSNTDAFDSSRLQETGRDLRTEDEIRTLAEKHQVLIVASSLDPMLASFPPLQTKLDPTVTHPKSYSSLSIPTAYERFRTDSRLEWDLADAHAVAAANLSDELAFEYQSGNSNQPIQVPAYKTAAATKSYPVNRHSKMPEKANLQPSFGEIPAGNLAILNANAEQFAASDTHLGFDHKTPPGDSGGDPPQVLPFKKTHSTRTKKIRTGTVQQPLLNFAEEDTSGLLKNDDSSLSALSDIQNQSSINNELDDAAATTSKNRRKKARLGQYLNDQNQLQS